MSKNDTYIFYIIIYLLLLLLALIAMKRKYSKGIHFLIAFILFSIISFRKVGVDREVYVQMYQYTPYYLHRYTLLLQEPLYFLVNIISYYIFHNFIFVQVTQAFFYGMAIFTVLEYLNKQKLDEVISLSFILATSFFYMMGLNRMCIAISIFTIAFFRYQENNNSPQYLLLLTIASLFHYSLLFVGILYWVLFVVFENKRVKRVEVYLGIIAPVTAYVLFSKIASILGGNDKWFKYQMYFDSSFNINGLKNVVYVIPILVIYLLSKNKLQEKICDENFLIIMQKQMSIILLLAVLSTLFNGAYRFTLAVINFIAIYYSEYFRLIGFGDKKIKIIVKILFVLLITLYCIITFFDSRYITYQIVPYSFI